MAHERIVTTAKTLADFSAYLGAKGTPMPPKPNEHFRAKCPGGVAVIMAARGGGWRLTPTAYKAWQAFEPAGVKVSVHRATRFKSIALRDGPVCFYCGSALTPAAATLEHLVPKAHQRAEQSAQPRARVRALQQGSG